MTVICIFREFTSGTFLICRDYCYIMNGCYVNSPILAKKWTKSYDRNIVAFYKFMTNIGLTTGERKELEKRGFLIQKNFTIWDLVQKISSIVRYLSIAIFIATTPLVAIWLLFATISEHSFGFILTIGNILTIILAGLVFVLPILNLIYSYMKTWMTFKSQKWTIRYGVVIPFKSSWKGKYFFFFDSIVKNIAWSGTWGIWAIILSLLYIFFMFFINVLEDLSLTYDLLLDIRGIIWYIVLTCIYILIPLIVIGLFMMIMRSIFQKFHPLYAFGNLGEKIQKLMPQIESQSKTMQKNFASDMSYRILSDGFDGLASTFSQIVSLVIRLEKVEARANRGNLFDSGKYISSLRSDIVGPLGSLRIFLDGKRTELISSREELSRVGVKIGWAIENRDLTSARTEPLILELTENIEKLDMMIGKMR